MWYLNAAPIKQHIYEHVKFSFGWAHDQIVTIIYWCFYKKCGKADWKKCDTKRNVWVLFGAMKQMELLEYMDIHMNQNT